MAVVRPLKYAAGATSTQEIIDAEMPDLRATIGIPKFVEDRTQFLVPETFGASDLATANADSNATALLAMFTASNTTKVPVKFSANRLYRVGRLSIPAGVKVFGRCRLTPIISTASTTPDIVVGAGASFEDLSIEVPAPRGLRNEITATLGDKVTISGKLSLTSTTQTDGSVSLDGDNIDIGYAFAENINRPFYQDAAIISNPAAPLAYRSGLKIRKYYIKNYIRGLRFIGVENALIGAGKMEGRSSQASRDNGQNSVLIGGMRNSTFGDADTADSPEHAWRIGGSPMAGFKSSGLAFGNIVVRRSGGCAFKSNETLVISGVTQTADNVSIASLTVHDCGYPTGWQGFTGPNLPGGSNSEALRLSHIRRWSVGPVSAFKDQGEASCYNLLKLVDVDGLDIVGMYADDVRTRIVTLETGDDPAGNTPDVRNVTIGDLRATCQESIAGIGFSLVAQNEKPATENSPFIPASPVGKISNFRILRGRIGGMTPRAQSAARMGIWDGGSLVDGQISISLIVDGGVPGHITSVPADDRVQLDVRMISADGMTATAFKGRAVQYNPRSFNLSADGFDPSNISPDKYGPTFTALDATPNVSGAFGPSLTFERPGGNRRGVCIVEQQESSSAGDVALSFWFPVTSASNAVEKRFVLHWDGSIELLKPGRGYVAAAPDGTRYKLVPPNGGGAASWSAV